jgi:hypothetical protein
VLVVQQELAEAQQKATTEVTLFFPQLHLLVVAVVVHITRQAHI